MDCPYDTTKCTERKKGQHLPLEERGAIQHLNRQGCSNRAIARELGYSPSTAANELRRGTPPRKSSKGKAPGYSANSVLPAMQQLKEEYSAQFAQVFKTITVDNGSEFADFAQVEYWGCQVYFAHPYTLFLFTTSPDCMF